MLNKHETESVLTLEMFSKPGTDFEVADLLRKIADKASNGQDSGREDGVRWMLNGAIG